MIGHGCRHGRNRPVTRFRVRTGVLALSVILAIVQLQAVAVEPLSPSGAPIDRRIELHWKSDSPRRWAGTLHWAEREVSAESGADRAGIRQLMSDPINLTPGPLLSAGVLETDRGGLRFGPPSRLTMLPESEGKLARVLTTRGGFSFRIRGDHSDALVLRLEGDDDSTGVTWEFPLAELEAQPRIEKSIDADASISIGCVSGDLLPVRFGTGITVLAPGEVVEVTLAGEASVRSEATDSELMLECLTYAARDQTLIRTDVWPAKIVAGRLTLDRPQWTAPAEEGAYRVHWKLRAKTAPRVSITSGLTPLARAASWSQSIGEAMPPTLSATFQLPLGSPLSLTSSTENAPVSQSEFSIAVMAPQAPEPHQIHASPDRSSQWRVIGKAEPREGGLSVSRLLPRQTSDWLAAASVNPLMQRTPIHDGKRLTLLAPGVQLEYSVPVSGVGQRHRALIRVPTGAVMQIAVELVDGPEGADAKSLSGTRPLGPGLVIARTDFTADAQPWYLASIDFWPRSPNTRIVLTNPSATEVASFESIEIQADQSDAAGPLSRGSDPPPARLAAMRLELNDLFEQFGETGVPTIENALDYQTVWVAGTRLIETLVREGYGGVILTVSSDGAACYPSEMELANASWNANWATAGGSVDALELLLRMFDRASLKLVPCIRPSAPLAALEQAMLSDPAANASIAAASPLGGQLGKWSFDGPPLTAFGLYNPTHPMVAEQVGAWFGELSRRCSQHPCVSTIGIVVDERTYLRLPPIAMTDPQTLDAFHASLGDAAPQRATIQAWIQNDGSAVFEQWRTERAQGILRQILDRLNNLSLLVLSLDSALPSHLVEMGRDPRILTTRLHRRSLIEPLGLRIRDEACNASVPISVGPSKSPWSHAVGIFHQPISELSVIDPSQRAVSPRHRGEAVIAEAAARLTPLLDQEESSLAFAQLLSRSDRKIIAIGGGGMNQPGSEVRRRSMQCFSQLPPVVMTDVASEKNAMSAVRVRHVRYQGNTYIYATNQMRWPVSVELTLSRAAAISPLGQRHLAGSDPVAESKRPTFEADPPASRRHASAARWNPTLAAGELLAIRITGEDIEISSWKANFAGEEQQLAMIRNSVQDAVAALSRLVDPTDAQIIENGDFEQPASEGIAGWLTAQYPPGCVAIDPAVSFRGKQSLRLTGQTEPVGGSWIVSQVLSPPPSRRLAVSVRLRAEPSQPDQSLPPLVVQMALEGTVAGTPIRKAISITVPRDGNWTEPAERLEIALLPSVPVESLRLTIDLMSPGVVWIDEVSCFDHFMTSGEKTQLDHLVFLAAGGASRGDWTGASRLLDSHWVQELASSRSTDKTRDGSRSGSENRVTVARRDASRWGAHVPTHATRASGSSDSPEQLRPGLVERLKSWLPRPVRF